MSAAGEELIRSAFEAWRPPPKLSLSEWADAYFYLSAESSADSGKWHTIPYQKGIMDAMTDPSIEFVSVQKSARVGYTKIVNILAAYHMHQDPCPIMIVQPTIEDAEGYSKEEIAPMLRDTPVLQGLVADARARDSSNTITQKTFPGGTLSLVGANSPRGFRRVSRRVIIFDETDGYPPSAGAEGDQIKLGIRRAEYYWNRKIVAGSTPTIKDLSRIEKMFADGDQRYYFVPCPHCGSFQTLKFGGPDKPYGLKWPQDEPEKAYYTCAAAACVIEHSHKRWMIERGEWRATAVGKPRHASFHIWAAYSFSPNATWGQIAAEFLDSKNDPMKLRTWVNTVLGETWEEVGDQFDAGNLKARLEPYAGEVPHGVGVLVASIDVQGDRLECSVVGYGHKEENWQISYEQLHGDPGKTDVWSTLDDILLRKYTHESGAEMTIAAVAIDSGGLHTEHVYRFAKPRALRRVHGAVQHVYPIKGIGGTGREILGRPSSKNRYKVKLFAVGVDTAKDTLFSRMRLATPGPGYMHLPDWLDDEFLEQLTAEKALRKYKKGVGMVREYVKLRDRNEALDLQVYALAALYMLGRNFLARLATLAAELSRHNGPIEPPPGGGDTPPAAPQAPNKWSNYGNGGRGGWVSGWR